MRSELLVDKPQACIAVGQAARSRSRCTFTLHAHVARSRCNLQGRSSLATEISKISKLDRIP